MPIAISAEQRALQASIRDTGGLAADPAVAQQVGAVVPGGLAGSLMDLRAALAQPAGSGDTHQAAVRKLVGVAHRQAVAETALVLCGPDGAASDGPVAEAAHALAGVAAGDPAEEETAQLRHWLDIQAKRNVVLTFGGGVNEIQRELIATAGLGLPRVPRGT